MKVSREQAAKNRELVVEAAGRLFREKGLDGISVAEIMQGAKLTHGGFYGQFNSKGDLAAEACERGLSRSIAFWNRIADESPEPLEEICKHYLCEDHLKSPGKGCYFSTLAVDVSRKERGLRRVFTAGFRASIDAIARAVKGKSVDRRRDASIAVISQLVGALVIARAVDDETLAKEILDVVNKDIEQLRR